MKYDLIRIKEVINSPRFEADPSDENYNLRHWCKMLIVRLEREQKKNKNVALTICEAMVFFKKNDVVGSDFWAEGMEKLTEARASLK